jgi:hypothetical protein
MPGTLTWPIDDAFRAMVELAEHRKEDILFVKDQGVYLMARGLTDNAVCYAEGFNPEKDDFDDWYDKAHTICGGDDFAETIPLATFQMMAGNKHMRKIEISISETHMNIGASA